MGAGVTGMYLCAQGFAFVVGGVVVGVGGVSGGGFSYLPLLRS